MVSLVNLSILFLVVFVVVTGVLYWWGPGFTRKNKGTSNEYISAKLVVAWSLLFTVVLVSGLWATLHFTGKGKRLGFGCGCNAGRSTRQVPSSTVEVDDIDMWL